MQTACTFFSKLRRILLPCGQKGGGFGVPESHQPFSLLLSGESVSSATVQSNKPALPTGRVSCLKAPLPNNFEEKEKRRILRLPSFSLFYHLYQIPVLCSISESYRVPFI